MKTRAYLLSLLTISMLSACSQLEATSAGEISSKYNTSQTPAKETEMSGFDCIAEFKDRLYLLGRGNDYPNFIAQDITIELIKQDPESKLISATCKSEVELGVKFADVIVDGTAQQSLDYLEASFPLELVVFNGEENWILDTVLQYQVDGLSSQEIPTLTKHFKVIESYDENRRVLKKFNLNYSDSSSD